ncbi:MAG: VWA domain-containing protein [Melioribacteraceae bacterium]|nr:VWA domain-containing protein [Melioribacteraceae bacterium]MCF8263513.1 VWA domain-containing protein [Melioribacteraceae bacterium]MCF8431825.1 VWA domain-containing protein [Melioribacteraceae bacterium]
MSNFFRKFLLSIVTVFSIYSCSLEGTNNITISSDEIPNSPRPSNNSSDQLPAVTLSWSANNSEKFNVLFDTKSPPETVIAAGIKDKFISVSGLNDGTVYYWQIISTTVDGESAKGPIWNFRTKSKISGDSGYIFQKDSSSISPPNLVSVIFQVLNLDGIGLPGLDSSDFELSENGEAISAKESNYTIKQKDQIPHSIKTVLMLDNSTSLGNDLDTIKQAAIALVDNIIDNQEIAVYTFSDSPILVQGFTSNSALLKSAINSITTGFATTNLYGAFVVGAAQLIDQFSFSNVVQSMLIVFTDGKDTQSSTSFNSAKSAVTGKQVYTVGLGNDIEPEILDELGTAGFYSISQANELTDKFLEIQNEIDSYSSSFYILNYYSPKRGNNTHLLRLSLVGNTFTGAGSTLLAEYNSSTFYSVKSGIYINSTQSDPDGIDSLTMLQNATRILTASSFLFNLDPKYTWSVADQSIIKLTVNQTDNAKALLEAVGAIGKKTNVTASDISNNVSKTITVTIK